MIRFSCPNCAKILKIEDECLGKQSRCPHCNLPFEIGRAANETGPSQNVLPRDDQDSLPAVSNSAPPLPNAALTNSGQPGTSNRGIYDNGGLGGSNAGGSDHAPRRRRIGPNINVLLIAILLLLMFLVYFLFLRKPPIPLGGAKNGAAAPNRQQGKVKNDDQLPPWQNLNQHDKAAKVAPGDDPNRPNWNAKLKRELADMEKKHAKKVLP